MPFPRPAILTDREWPLVHGDQRAVVSARGGALRSYQVAGESVVDGWADHELPPAFNGAVLAPWPNRIRDGRWTLDGDIHALPINELDRHNALHGLVMWADWQLISHQSHAITLGCRVAAQPGYPFDLQLRVSWLLTEAGLRCELAAVNADTRPSPFGVATHPFFGFEAHPVDELTLTVPARALMQTDDRLLPIELVEAAADFRSGRRLAGVALDTAFTGLDREPDGTTEVRLASPAGVLTVWADQAFGWWQVYTSDMFEPTDPRHRRSVAVEAMTCGPDAFNTGTDVLILEPGEQWRGSWGAWLSR